MKNFYVYILASGRNGTLYIGITSDLKKRVFEHKNKTTAGFTSKYDVNKLVYFEQTEDPISAISREKALKKWNRSWKLRIINSFNIEWRDLYDEI